MPVLMFQDRFAPKVADGSKPHTIRPRRARPIKVGDKLSLRKWKGKPYRSKQVRLCEAVCTEVTDIEILANAVLLKPRGVNGVIALGTDGETSLAKADGFDSFADMLAWFEQTHGLPFEGVLIRWSVESGVA